MENKINIAELLKDCPQGMELDCTMFDDVTFYGVSNEKTIVAKRELVNQKLYLDSYGAPFVFPKEDSKCVIFPKGKTTWEGFIPPCKFKDGDVLFVDCSDGEDMEYRYIFILNNPEIYGKWHSYCHLDGVGYFHSKVTYLTDEEYHPRLATEEEKQKLFDAIKENGFKWNDEIETLEELYHYPKTIYECCAILGFTELGIIAGYRHGLLTQFRNLLICRDAYWKIAGDWKFDFDNEAYYLCNEYHEIRKFNGTCDCNAVLAFPTEEMRDAFYENFKELMNECKSLL